MARVLLDTNVLLRAVNVSHPEHSLARAAVAQLLGRADDVFLTPQVLTEFWSVATRPASANGGFGWEPGRLRAEVEALQRQFPLLEDTPDVFRQWLALMNAYDVSGKQVHDAHGTVMQAHAVTYLLTFNTSDFTRYAAVRPVHPSRAAEVANGQ